MRRSALDKLISYVGLALAAVMFVAGGLLTWASAFVNEQVTNQLVSQRIDMPGEKGIAGLKDPKDQEALRPYIGQQMSTGDQAKAFADNYILAHMNASSNGKTYEEVSGEFMQLSPEQKASEEGQKMAALRESLFMGNTLRGLLLNAYAFATMGKIAAIAAVAAFVGGVVLLVLSFLGFRHSKSPSGESMVA
ncbi:hypothetical protein AADG42_10450 [Ammonicoccus fulvus]|uniref:Aromatic ring-opening dioxygenase LigA n=1 Tax=Ammonicoccus fulvus TaxID=3138240 RepID=A0ABZ3FNU1_9ACTN